MSRFTNEMTLEHVAAAMDSLQRTETTPATRKEVDKFLLDFQRSRRAWELCLETLKDPVKHPLSLRLFAAQTIRQKASRDCIIGSTSHNSSFQKGRDAGSEVISTTEYHSLVAPIATIASTERDRPVRVQLCLTLASLLLRSEGDPSQAVSESLSCLQSTPALLDFVSILPEEWASPSVKV